MDYSSSRSSSFNGFTRQASFFLKEKIKFARLALTDVTPAQLLIEEATNEDLPAPSTHTMTLISKAAFEVDDYWRIVDLLHKRTPDIAGQSFWSATVFRQNPPSPDWSCRTPDIAVQNFWSAIVPEKSLSWLSRFDRKNWRSSYKALTVLEHLLNHGPERVAEEFQSDKEVIKHMGSFQYVDERGFNWGLSIRKKSEMTIKLLEDTKMLKQERARARKLAIGIKGFGSFNHTTTEGRSLHQSADEERYGRWNSHPNHGQDYKTQEEEAPVEKNSGGKTEEFYGLCTRILPEKMMKSATTNTMSRFGGEYKPLENRDSDHQSLI